MSDTRRSKFALVALALALLFSPALSADANLDKNSPSDSVQPLLGRWDLTLKAADRVYPSWLELRQENGKLTAQMVGRWGNARPLPKAEFSEGQLTLVSPKEEEDLPVDMIFTGKLNGKNLEGSVTGPKDGPWTWSGVRAPALDRKGAPQWGRPVSLFNGKDLTGWKMSDPRAKAVWTVENGTLVSPGHGPEIINDLKFQDFKLHIEFNCGAKANSGVYLRGRYEVQVEDNSVDEPPSHHTGGVYGFITPKPEMPRKPGEWQSFDITLEGRTITVVQNGTPIIDQQEIPGITGGALDSHEELPGPIYLQGSEDNHVAYRNIVVTPAK